jgi:glyoxylase-like metal-dependent hydrolase (beta-lactamase superfamily II)
MTDTTPATYAPIPESSLGPALNEQGYHVDRIERNLFWVTDGVYQSAFLATDDGVVLFDAPPTIGHNLRRAVDEITSAEGTTNKVTHLVYSHHHADHAGGASVFGDEVIRIGHEDTRRLLLRENDATRPAPDVTFQENHTLTVGGEIVELSHHGSNHSPDNIFMHFPNHDTMMVVDIVNIGWVPIFNVNLSEDVPGYIAAPDTALSYPWQHYVGGHLGRLGSRADVELHQQYINDIVDSSRSALAEIDPTPYYQNAWPNMWAGVKDHLGAVTELATKPVVAKYTGVLAAADVEELTYTTTFMIMQSLRLDYGVGSYVHP